ncbi:MAG TPA: hypothetical protein VEV15_01615 [Flavisolibacter sp.]|nr:hypothetical protein [Flavisolibacter sp.]
MKKLSLFVLTVFLSVLSFAQRGNVQFGIKGGVNLADYNYKTRGFITGFHIG